MSGPTAVLFFDCYFCAIAIYSIIDSKRWHFLFHVHAAFRLVHNVTQLLLAKRDSWFTVLLFFLFSCHVCPTLPPSSDIFPQTPQPHLIHTHLLSSQLSIPNRLTGLWQKMLVDLLGALGSSGACLTCIFLERHLALSHPSRVSCIQQ